MNTRWALYALISFLIFSLITTVCYFIIYKFSKIGYQNIIKLSEIYTFPFIYSFSLFLCIKLLKPIRNKWYLLFPLFILLVKFIFICFGYDIYSGDFLLSTLLSFSQLFNILLWQLDISGLQNNATEILLITLGSFIYQVTVLVIANTMVNKSQFLTAATRGRDVA